MIAETPTEEYALIIKTILEDRGYSVGDKDDFKSDVTLNILEPRKAILIGSIRDDKSWGMIRGNGQVMEINGHKFNLADPSSHIKIGDELQHIMGVRQHYSYHFVP